MWRFDACAWSQTCGKTDIVSAENWRSDEPSVRGAAAGVSPVAGDVSIKQTPYNRIGPGMCAGRCCVPIGKLWDVDTEGSDETPDFDWGLRPPEGVVSGLFGWHHGESLGLGRVTFLPGH